MKTSTVADTKTMTHLTLSKVVKLKAKSVYPEKENRRHNSDIHVNQKRKGCSKCIKCCMEN